MSSETISIHPVEDSAKAKLLNGAGRTCIVTITNVQVMSDEPKAVNVGGSKELSNTRAVEWFVYYADTFVYVWWNEEGKYLLQKGLVSRVFEKQDLH